MAKGNRLGRPSKLTAQMQMKLCQHIADGYTYRVACGMEGIHVHTLMVWKRKGAERPKSKYGYFLLAIEKAEAQARKVLEGYARTHASKDGRIAIAILERRHPDDWGKERTIKHTGKVEQEHSGSVSVHLSPEERRDRIDKLTRQRRHYVKDDDGGSEGS